jgi:type IV secretory pathway TraG/TraD family ATPase VirD4
MEEAQRQTQGTNRRPEMEKAERYWLQEFPCLADKTRSILVTSLSALIDGFYNSDIHDLFCRDTTLIPEATQQGAIILIDLPLKTRDFTGLLAQCIWKHFFQKAIERRSEPPDASRRPVFLWADEAQFLYTDYDALFQSTARSAACATVYLTQNIANFYGIYGGNRDKIDGFLGNLNTKIFHANNDHASNLWAAEQIGKATQYRASVSSREDQPARGWQDILRSIHSPPSGNVTTSSYIDYAVQPSEFAKLRTGAEHNDLQVDAYFTKSGARFSNGKHYFKTTFLQEF